MKLAKPLILSFSLLAFAGATAYAADEAKEKNRDTQAQTQQSTQAETKSSASGSAGAGATKQSGKTESTTQADTKSGMSKEEDKASGSAAAGGSTSGSAATQQQSDQDKSAAAGAGGKSQQDAMKRGELRVSKLKDMNVVNSKGEELGEISDVVINLSSGKVHAVVLGFGGFLGVGEEHYAFAPNEVKPGKQANQVVVDIDKQKLENRDGFSKSQWPGMDDEYWGKVGGKQAATGSGAKQGGGQGAEMNLVRASELKGKDVQGKDGKKVGEVQDIIVGLQNGEVKNIAVNVEGGGRAMVPGKAIKASGTDNKLVLDMNADQLRAQAKQRRPAGAGASIDTSAGRPGDQQNKMEPGDDKSKQNK